MNAPLPIALGCWRLAGYHLARKILALAGAGLAGCADASRRTVVNTLKSAALILVLIGVLYGVYMALNKPDPPAAAEVLPAGSEALTIEYSSSAAASVPAPPALSPAALSPATLSPATLSPAESETAPAPMPPPRSIRGGAFQPEIDPTSPAPPLAPPSPAQSAAAQTPLNGSASGLQQSAYESPLASPAAGSSPATAVESSAAANAAAATSPAASDASGTSAALATYALRRDMTDAAQLAGEGKYRAALAKLTSHYFVAELPAEDRQQLVAWLDPLAAKVIYSR
jgi:hypothetical protein